MSIKLNIIKGWITTIIGMAAMIITLILVWQQVFDFVWEGIGGLVIGALLLLAPRTIEKKISEIIKAWGQKNNNSFDDYTPPPGDV